MPSLAPNSPGVENRQEASSDGDMILESALVISDTEFANIGGEHLDWDDLDVDFADFLNPQINDKTVLYPSSGPSSLIRHSTPPTHYTVQQTVSSPNVSIPGVPTNTIRSFIHRPKMKTGAQGIASLTLQTLVR